MTNSVSDLKQNKYSSWQLVKDTGELVKPYKWRFFFASLIRLAGDLANLYPAYALAVIITFLTNYKSGESLSHIWIVLGLSFVALVTRNLSQFFSKYLGFYIADKVGVDSTLKAIKHMFLLDMAWHEKENSGNKIKRIEKAGDGFTKIIRLYFDNVIEILVNLIAINVIIFKFDHTVLLFLLLFLVTYFIISFLFIDKAAKAHREVNKKDEELNGILFEAINNIRTVKVMSMGDNLFRIISDYGDDLAKKLKQRIMWYQSRWNFLSFWTNTFKTGITVVIIYGVVNGYYEAGFLILFYGYFGNLRDSVDELSTSIQDFVTSRYSIARLKDILNEPINIDKESGKVPLEKDWSKIFVRDLSFAYGGNKVLDNVSFEISRGEKVGIVGLSGAGKSTLFKLLLKERQEFDGIISFDNTSIKNISKKSYFEQVSVVLQDTEVFNLSLRENITITNYKERDNTKLLDQALNTAHISEFLGKLPQGLDTIIGEKGVKLSGGERQRLGIARAVFKEPQVLLLDEATSHLDIESEEKIKDSLHKFFESVTAVVIAHRLTTIKEMDKIIVIEDGKILESGNFEELHAKRGRFYELWEKQNL